MQNQQLHKIKGNLIILITAIIWGTSFISQKVGMERIEPATFNGIRLIIGSISLLPVILFQGSFGKAKPTKADKSLLIKGGIMCGIFLSIATYLQTWGLVYTTSGKSGFITALYMMIVPFLGIAIGRKVSKFAFLSAGIALVGLYLLCGLYGEISFNFGDLLTLFCAFLFALHILAIDHFSPKTDGVKLSAMQFFVAGIINIVIMLLFETPNFADILTCWFPILYSGIFACGIAYTLQIIGQRYTDPTSASILMSLESVFALISGMLLLGEMMSWLEYLGCALMFLAVIINTLKA